MQRDKGQEERDRTLIQTHRLIQSGFTCQGANKKSKLAGMENIAMNIELLPTSVQMDCSQTPNHLRLPPPKSLTISHTFVGQCIIFITANIMDKGVETV